MANDEQSGELTYWTIMPKGVLSVGKLLVTSAGDIRRFRQTTPSEERCVRPGET